jgi:hypothetical protein
MDRLAVMETADGVTAEEGRSSDRVMGWARRLQAVQGASATVGDAERRMLEENGLAQLEIEEVRQVLDLLQRASNGSSPHRRLEALLAECGAPQGEGDLLQAERIYYRGQAAALLATDRRWVGDFREDDALIEELLLRNEPPRLRDAVPAPATTRNESAAPVEKQDSVSVSCAIMPRSNGSAIACHFRSSEQRATEHHSVTCSTAIGSRFRTQRFRTQKKSTKLSTRSGRRAGPI